jgi:Flp pilus assembly protein TadD
VLSDEVRASLEAVRVAQVAARLRVRRQTVRTRIWVAAVGGAVGLVALAFGPRIAGRRQARPTAATAATVATATVATVAPPSPISPEAVAPAIAPPATETVVAAATEVAPVAVRRKAADVVGPVEGCDTRLIRRAPWRLSPQACARAFDADPTNAALALAIAHAEHAHGSLSEAGQWAKRAVALNPEAAEAYTLIARAELAQGRRDEARTAYRRYLELAPRGWHRAEARAAVEAADR